MFACIFIYITVLFIRYDSEHSRRGPGTAMEIKDKWIATLKYHDKLKDLSSYSNSAIGDLANERLVGTGHLQTR